MFQLITGPAGSGKTTKLVTRTAELLSDGKFVSVLLPTQILIDDFQRRLLKEENFAGSLNVKFFTFYTFVKDVLFRGNVDFTEVDNPGLTLVLEHFLRENKNDYPELVSAEITTGFLHSLLEYFSDLANGAVDKKQAVQVANYLGKKDDAFLREIHHVYHDFFQWLEQKHMTSREQLFLYALQQLQQNENAFGNSHLIIDGFYDLNPVQRQLIEAVTDNAASVTMSLLTGSEPVFRYTDETKNWSKKLCEKHQGTHEELKPQRLYLQELETLFHPDRTIDEAEIRFVEAASPFLEVQETVRNIKRDILTGNYAPEEIAVLYRRQKDYYRQLVDASRREGIPLANGHDQPLAANPAISVLTQWYEILTNDFPREETLQWLQSDFIQPNSFKSKKDVELLVHLSTEAQIIDGQSNWIERIQQLLERVDDEGKAQRVGWTIKKLQRLWEALPESRTQSLTNHLKDFARLVEVVNFRAAVKNSSSATDDNPGRDVRALNAMQQLIKTTSNLASEFEIPAVSTSEFAQIFRELLKQERYVAETGEPDGATFTTVEHARGLFWKKVYLVGLNDEVFPVRHRTHPLVKLRDRIRLNRLLNNDCNILEHRADLREEQLLFYSALTRSTEALQISTITGSDTLLLSPFYEELKSGMSEESESSASAEEITADFLADPPPEKSWLTIDLLQHLRYTTNSTDVNFLDGNQFHHLLNVVSHRNGKLFTEFDGSLTSRDLLDEVSKSIFTEISALSPSRLEMFYVSPFQYFARYLLNLKEPEEVVEELPPDIRGRILHDVMEQFYRNLPDSLQPKVVESNLEAGLDFLESVLTDVYLRYEQQGLPLPDLLWAREKELLTQYCRNTVSFFATTYPWNARDMVPDKFEFTFGEGKPESAPAFELEQDDKVLRFKGRADRLDVNQATGQFTVVDYKTSRGKRKKDFWNGRALQLQVYAMAAQAIIDNYSEPLRLSYYSFMQNKEDTKIDFTRDDSDQLFASTENLIWDAVTRMEQGEFYPVAGECSRYCPVKHICRCEENRIRRKSSV